MMCQLSNGHTIINTGVHPIEYFIDNELWATSLVKMRELYDFDGILCHKPGRVKHLMDLVERVDYDMEVPTLYLNDGSRIECTRDDDAYYKKTKDFKFPTLEELDIEHPLDWAPESYKAFQASKGTYDYKTIQEIPDHVFGMIDRVIEMAGNEYSVHGEVRAPFDHFLNILGMEDGLMTLIDQPERAMRLMAIVTQWSVALAVAQVDRGAHAIKISSPFAGNGFLSEEMYEEYIIPYESQIARAVKEKDAFVYTHTCGGIGDRLNLLVECGVSGIECLDPPPLGNVDLKEAVDMLSGKIFIKGNIDPVNTLLRGDKGKIYSDVGEILDTAGSKMDGFILSSACSVAPPTPPENIKLLAEMVHEFKR